MLTVVERNDEIRLIYVNKRNFIVPHTTVNMNEILMILLKVILKKMYFVDKKDREIGNAEL
jgi:hypothetical protein